MKENEKTTYETPTIEIIEFDFRDSIATSGDFGPGVICGEELYQ